MASPGYRHCAPSMRLDCFTAILIEISLRGSKSI